MKISKSNYRGADMIELVTDGGLGVTLCGLGAGMASIKFRDRDGVLRELLKPNGRGYGGGHNGLTTGRTAGRIENATFEIDGRVAKLEANSFGVDNLHGGTDALHKKIFAAEVHSCERYADVAFTYDSPDGEGGFFGNVRFCVNYRVYEHENRIDIRFTATPDCKTLVNPTNHAYFDASGDLREPCTEQTLYLNASRIGVLDERSIVRGIAEVQRHFDFRTPRRIGEYINERDVQEVTHGYDHPYFLDTAGAEETAAYLYSEKSGIKIEVRTTYPCLVLYSDNGDGNRAACLECQYHPDGIHAQPENCGVCSPEKPFDESIILLFSLSGSH